MNKNKYGFVFTSVTFLVGIAVLILGSAAVGVYISQKKQPQKKIFKSKQKKSYWQSSIWIDVPARKLKVKIDDKVNIEGHITNDKNIKSVLISVDDQKQADIQDFKQSGQLKYFNYQWKADLSGEKKLKATALGEDQSEIATDWVIIEVEEEVNSPSPSPVRQTASPEPEPESEPTPEPDSSSESIKPTPEPTPQPTPRPTPSPEDNSAPSAPTLKYPIGGTTIDCTARVDLDWNAISDPSGIENYTVEVQWHFGDENWQSASGSPFTITNTQLEIDTECALYYRWRVKAKDNAGNSSNYSSWEEFQVNLM